MRKSNTFVIRFTAASLEMMHGGEVFIPKLPSMSMLDVARTIAPECEIETIGFRAGEKLHETLITVDEARQSVDIGDRYVIQPAHPWWSDAYWADGIPLPHGAYSSDTNLWRLTPDELLSMIERREHAVLSTR